MEFACSPYVVVVFSSFPKNIHPWFWTGWGGGHWKIPMTTHGEHVGYSLPCAQSFWGRFCTPITLQKKEGWIWLNKQDIETESNSILKVILSSHQVFSSNLSSDNIIRCSTGQSPCGALGKPHRWHSPSETWSETALLSQLPLRRGHPRGDSMLPNGLSGTGLVLYKPGNKETDSPVSSENIFFMWLTVSHIAHYFILSSYSY